MHTGSKPHAKLKTTADQSLKHHTIKVSSGNRIKLVRSHQFSAYKKVHSCMGYIGA